MDGDFDFMKYPKEVDQLIKIALLEDEARSDVTTMAVFSKKAPQKKAILLAKENFVLSGIDIAQRVFLAVSPKIKFKSHYKDSDLVKKGKTLAEVKGSVADLLKAERVMLNFLQHLSGVATWTNKFVQKTKAYDVKIMDTRKTTPGFRFLEKKAVVDGGGVNHRFSLKDQFLIKDNHIEAAGGIKQAIKAVKKAKKNLLVEIEVKNLSELQDALEEEADIILLDNMTQSQIKKAVKMNLGPAELEVSGGVNLSNVLAYAKTGVERISIGALTHSAPNADISFLIVS